MKILSKNGVFACLAIIQYITNCKVWLLFKSFLETLKSHKVSFVIKSISPSLTVPVYPQSSSPTTPNLIPSKNIGPYSSKNFNER